MQLEELGVKKWRAAASFLIAGAALYVLYINIDIGRVWEIVSGANLFFYAVALLMFYATFPLRGLRWKLLLDNTSIETNTRDASETVFLSFYLNNIVPAKLGDVYRAHRIRPSRAVARSRILGTVVTCRVLDFVVLAGGTALLGGFALSGKFGFLSEPLLYSLAALSIFAVGLVAAREELLDLVLPARLKEMLLNAKEGFLASMKKKKAKIIGITLAIWGLVATRMFFVFQAIGVDAGFLFASFLALFVILLSVFPLTPAGLGIVEVVSTTLLELYGFGASMGASIVLLDRSITFMSILVIGSIYVALFRRGFLSSLERLEDHSE